MKTLLAYARTKKHKHANIEVELPGFPPKLLVIGYIPYQYDIPEQAIAPESYAILHFNVQSGGKRFPIATEISFNSDKFEMGEDIKLFNWYSVNKDVCANPLRFKTRMNKTILFRSFPDSFLVKSDDEAEYIPKPGECVFFKEGKAIAVAESFMCLCRYMNLVTGKCDTMIQFPEDLYMVR